MLFYFQNKYIQDYHNFNTEIVLIKGYPTKVRRSLRNIKKTYNQIPSISNQEHYNSTSNYHVHHYKRSGDKSFFCTKCNNLNCCNQCRDCGSIIISNSKDFDSDDDLKIDSDLDSNNSKDENSSSSNIIYPIYSYLFNKK